MTNETQTDGTEREPCQCEICSDSSNRVCSEGFGRFARRLVEKSAENERSRDTETDRSDEEAGGR